MSSHADLFTRAKAVIAGGVNSPVRAFQGVGGTPLFIDRAAGAYLIDAEGRNYIDYVGSWGPMILGHNHPQVSKALSQQIDKGISFGAPTALETKLAEQIIEAMPVIEMIRFVSSGTEATMSAIRLARAATQRDRILKFAGCYHGHSDSLLVAAGSGPLTLGVPSSPGVPQALAEQTCVAAFNDLSEVSAIFQQYGEQIACVILEPIAGNMGCILPNPGFLRGVRELCDQYGSLLIFDEVMTGFRVARGGATSLFDVTPDLVTLAKVIGGGLPVGAFGGKRSLMEKLAPLGPVYQAGTLSGNPLAMAAGIATLTQLAQPDFYRNLQVMTTRLVEGLTALAKQKNIPLVVNAACGMFSLFFTEEQEVSSYQQVMQVNAERFKQFFHAMLEYGIYLAPSPYESLFLSAVHLEEEIELTLAAAENAFATLHMAQA